MKIKQIFFACSIVLFFSMSSFVGIESKNDIKLGAEEQRILFLTSMMSKDELLNITPTSFEEKTGRKLSFSESLMLKKVVKKLNMNADNASNVSGTSSKSQGVAFLLALFLGGLGIHRFYLGKTGTGILQLIMSLTVILSVITFVWVLIDWIRIIMNDLKDDSGNTLKNWFD